MAASQNDLKRRLQVLMKRPENMVCSDCPERQPRWASLIVPPPGSPHGALPIGCFCCLECSGSHRRLGVHISFVRSVNLDQWKEREVLAMEHGGNAKVNSIFEARLHGNEKPLALADGRTRERFIRDKYERRKYFDPNALQQFYSFESSEEDDDDDEEEEEEAPQRPVAVRRAPSDAARRRAEKRRSRPAAPGVGRERRQDKPPKPAAAETASSAEPVMDLLDFGSMPAQSDPGPPPAPPSAPVTPLAVVRETSSSEQSVSVVGNTHDPFAVTAKAKSIEVSVKTVSTGGAATSASATSGGDQKQKPKLNSDDIMKMFNAPPQQMGGMMGMGGMNPAAMGMNMNGNNNMAMMNPMGGAPIGGMAQFGGAAAPMAGNGNFMMPQQQQQPNNPAGMMPQQQFNGGNYMMQQANGNGMGMGMGTMQQPPNNNNSNNNMMNVQQMQQQQHANMNMMMMQQQMQQVQITQGKNTTQQTWSSKTTEQVSGMQQQPNGNPNGMNAMNHIAMMNRLQMGNSPNMNMMGMATTAAAGGGNQQQDKQQQGQQQQMNQFAGMNGFGS